MHANPKETTSLRLDGTMKRRCGELLALHGMTLTEAFEEYRREGGLLVHGEVGELEGVVVTDGGSGFAKAVRETWPRTARRGASSTSSRATSWASRRCTIAVT